MEKQKFECRLCGSQEYETIKENNGILGPGYRSWVDYYICKGCSAIFKDVQRFSKIGQTSKE
jgi:hypothetical protein